MVVPAGDCFKPCGRQFVIVAAFDNTDPSLPVEDRVALGLKRCGVSVTCESIRSTKDTVRGLPQFSWPGFRHQQACFSNSRSKQLLLEMILGKFNQHVVP